jgi:hypothetical protein
MASDALPLPACHHRNLRRASIEEGDAGKRKGHALSPTERALILDGVPAAQKTLMYTASLRK